MRSCGIHQWGQFYRKCSSYLLLTWVWKFLIEGNIIKLLKFTWTFNTHRWNLQVPDLQINYIDLTRMRGHQDSSCSNGHQGNMPFYDPINSMIATISQHVLYHRWCSFVHQHKHMCRNINKGFQVTGCLGYALILLIFTLISIQIYHCLKPMLIHPPHAYVYICRERGQHYRITIICNASHAIS